MIAVLERAAEVLGIGSRDDDIPHLVCPCRPLMTLCGAYDDQPISDVAADGTECRECWRVLKRGCPGCGCRLYHRCARCDGGRYQ